MEAEGLPPEDTWGGQLRILLPAAIAVALLIAVVTVVAVTSGGRAPSVPAVALVGLRPAERPAAQVDGFPAGAVGRRRDNVGGRATTTVLYPGGLAYARVSGKPLDAPDGRRAGRFTTLADGDRRIVTWRCGTNTCVVSAPRAVPAARLLALAARPVS